MRRHKGSWIFFIVAVFGWFAPGITKAEPVEGLNAVGYIITSIPPTRSDTVYQTCGSELENNINRNYNGEPFQECPADNFMVHYTGFITIPENQTISFMVAADDGGTIKIGDTPEFGTWNLKGCTWSQPTSNIFIANTYALDGWFFEAGGYSCFILAWNINNVGWQIVPDSAFTYNAVPTTTSSTSTTTSSTSTTTTTQVPTTTTTITTSSTILPLITVPTTTTELSTTTTSSTSTLPEQTSTTTITVQSTTTTTTTSTTTTTQPPFVPSATLIPSEPISNVATISEQPTTTTIQESTTTTLPIETTSTETTTPTTLPEETTTTSILLPFKTYPSSTLPSQSETSLPETTLPEVQQPQTPDSQEIEVSEEKQPLVTTISPIITNETLLNFVENIQNSTVEEFATVLDAIFNEVVTDEVLINTFIAILNTDLNDSKFESVVDVLESKVISQEQVMQVVALIIEQEGGIDAEQATELATSAKVLESISEEQATEVFAAIVTSEVSPEDGTAIVEAVQNAPLEIREAFEKEINVFEGVFDEYVPNGSTISVAERRAVIAAIAVLFVVPIPTISSSQPATSSKKG